MFLSETPTSGEPGLNDLNSGLNDFSDMANNLLKENLSINQFKVFYEPFPENEPVRNVIKPTHIKLSEVPSPSQGNYAPYNYDEYFMEHLCKFISTYKRNRLQYFAFLESNQIDDEIRWNYTKALVCTKNLDKYPEVFMVISLRLEPTKNFEIIIQQLIQRQNFRNTRKSKFELLTPREKELLILLSKGFNNPAIAGKLFISRRTVEQHRKNLIRKIGTNSIREIINYSQSFDFQNDP